MKVEIWCQGYGIEYDEKKVWVGKLSLVPRLGDQVIIQNHDPEGVEAIYYDLDNASVKIKINPDFDNQYEAVP